MLQNQIHGNAAFSGGGSVSSQAIQTTEDGGTPAQIRDTQGYLPLTTKQIHEYYDASVNVDAVRIVGTVFNVEKSLTFFFYRFEKSLTNGNYTDITFELDDGDGAIDCLIRINNEEEDVESKMVEIENVWHAEIHGRLEGFQGKIRLEVFSVGPVTDYNQIAHHYVKNDHNSESQGHGSNSIQPQITNAAITNFSGQPRSVEFYQNVLNFSTSTKGLHRTKLAHHFKVSDKETMEVLGTLEEEGLVFSTTDEFHYKCLITDVAHE
ncbi:hypothetical protein MKW94_009272 [Papaver nudicaule]|uniref:Replication protein A C-terminal domain-containing protein n=1 Tax=Papaver nudicaule TaxID=74823 RepID=A0AA41VJW7_PAPNU|nr:hypothetical protein [Papaver nudicaule]